jgi:hypothetical protein
MARFEVTLKGANGLKVGDIVESDAMPAWLVGKAVLVADVEKLTLEVATPRRGRPPKEQSAE